ncbi:gamma-glutamyl-gamma-aminobutyrate hydrolase family protein [Pseudomonadales bacterium]|nr:gamma-glutamyl-gamma-aminobutyrate hydrolase family protein [Pseudomonadales bacterium]MDA8949877.1 gamma-glutamyl-gamma-aminobutyrate hydrolase family protein [Pseudomonadales bacterium]
MRKILLSMRVTESDSYSEFRNSIAYEYIEFFEKLNFLVILVPNNSTAIDKYFDDKIELVVLSGGNNVDPSLYQGDETLTDVYPERDGTEKEMFNTALKKNIKILAICRGFHAINVFLGGSISHNIKDHVNRFHKLLSNRSYLHNQETNSFHNQGIAMSDLFIQDKGVLLATTEDGFVEAATNTDRSILGIQWHPERQRKAFDIELIQNFLKGSL